MKAIQENDRLPTTGRTSFRKVKSIRKTRIYFNRASIKGVVKVKKRPEVTIYFRPGLKEGPGARKTLNALQFTLSDTNLKKELAAHSVGRSI